MNYANIRGAFVANDKLYYSTSTGALWRADWSGRSPVGGTQVQVSGPGKDLQNWASRSLFSFEGEAAPPVNQAPVASATVTCTDLSCSYNGSASSDPDGDTLTYAWDFGDTTSGSGATTTHEYATGGPRTVTLTVTDPSGATDSTTRSINPQPPANQAPVASATVTCTDLNCSYNGSASTDPDGDTLTYDWDFGDGSTGSGATTTHDYADGGPRTVTLTVMDPSGATDSTTRSSTRSRRPTSHPRPRRRSPVTCWRAASTPPTPTTRTGRSAPTTGTSATVSTGTGETTSHTYGSAGARTVTLTVTDNADATGSKTFKSARPTKPVRWSTSAQPAPTATGSTTR